jgi:hypothetical protein
MTVGFTGDFIGYFAKVYNFFRLTFAQYTHHHKYGTTQFSPRLILLPESLELFRVSQ